MSFVIRIISDGDFEVSNITQPHFGTSNFDWLGQKLYLSLSPPEETQQPAAITLIWAHNFRNDSRRFCFFVVSMASQEEGTLYCRSFCQHHTWTKSACMEIHLEAWRPLWFWVFHRGALRSAPFAGQRWRAPMHCAVPSGRPGAAAAVTSLTLLKPNLSFCHMCSQPPFMLPLFLLSFFLLWH